MTAAVCLCLLCRKSQILTRTFRLPVSTEMTSTCVVFFIFNLSTTGSLPVCDSPGCFPFYLSAWTRTIYRYQPSLFCLLPFEPVCWKVLLPPCHGLWIWTRRLTRENIMCLFCLEISVWRKLFGLLLRIWIFCIFILFERETLPLFCVFLETLLLKSSQRFCSVYVWRFSLWRGLLFVLRRSFCCPGILEFLYPVTVFFPCSISKVLVQTITYLCLVSTVLQRDHAADTTCPFCVASPVLPPSTCTYLPQTSLPVSSK